MLAETPDFTPAIPFRPSWPLRHPFIQSALASFQPRNRRLRGHAMQQAEARHELDCGDGVRLVGWHSPQPQGRKPRALAVLIHGWEGCHESVYLYSMACTLFDAGCNVFRLNLRDHGGTHALNEAMFHSARMGEVYGALRAIQQLDATTPLLIIGFSLGGNFALRLGMRGAAQGIHPTLTVGVCPAINPGATLTALDDGPKLFHRYFIAKWQRTLRAKQSAWPDRYDFSEIWPMKSFTAITERFVERYTEYDTLASYLETYTLMDELSQPSTSPLVILTAQDDPVVPFEDFRKIRPHPGLRIEAPAHGGHCGFIENWRMHAWSERRVRALLADLLGERL